MILNGRRTRSFRFASLLIVLVFVLGATDGFSGTHKRLDAVNLQSEYKSNPLGIEAPHPRLSWALQSTARGQRQAAYQILVSSTKKLLNRDTGDLWDTGRVDSAQTIHVVYQGVPLIAGQRCYWKVRTWSGLDDSKPSAWSKVAWWEMALLNPDDWQGEWINDAKSNPQKEEDFFKNDPAPLFRKTFTTSKKVRSARLYISGLGYYDAYINGEPVGDHALDPGWTRYEKRVYYSTYDVTEQLGGKAEKLNCLAVSVGNGWYNPLPLKMWGHVNLRERLVVGRPRLIAQLNIEYTDGTRASVVSDPSWKVAEGPMLRNSIYLGEVYDARREIADWKLAHFDDAQWKHAALATEPIGSLRAQPLAPIRVTKELNPVQVSEPKPGVYIYDMGQNFSGRVSLTVDVPEGTQINLRYGELLHEDGTLNPRTAACGQIKKQSDSVMTPGVWDPVPPLSAWQGDSYTAKGGGVETYEPVFTFHAFRYVEVTGYPGMPTADMMRGKRMNSDLKSAGTFSCSNPMLNKIQEITRWTFLSNVFSVQSDCPHRERFGYGGDLVNTCDAFMLNYDMANFYEKATRDWDDSALENGMLTDTAPSAGIQYCGVGWAMAHPLLQQTLYQYYGDRRIIEEQYATSERWFGLVAADTEDHIIKNGLSDHESLTKKPAPQMVTPLYCESARIMSRLATILGKKDEADHYAALAEKIRDAWFAQFVDAETGVVSPGTQASQAFALYLDMLPAPLQPAALDRLLEYIDAKDTHLSTGIFGTKYLLDVLSRRGRVDTAYNIANQRDFPSWGHMLENGATTLWEHWEESDDTYSHNHPMFGSVSQWFFNWLGGIQADPETIAFDRFSIKPQLAADLDWVKSSYKSIRGPIVSNWQRRGEAVEFVIEVPANATATLYLPTGDPDGISESGKPVAQAEGVEFLRSDAASTVYRIGAGQYQFTVK